MVKVQVWGSLRAATGGRAEVEVDGATFKEVIDQLAARYPGLAEQIEQGVSLAIDGVIYRDSWFTPVPEDAEVVLLPYMQGG